MGTKKGCGNDQHAADGLRARLHEIAYRDSAASVTVRADDLRAILAALPPPHEAAAAPRFALRNGQVAQLFDFGGTPPVGTPLEDQDVLVIQHAEAGHSGPGLYAHYENGRSEGQAAVAAIAFALDSATDGIAFLRSWNEGDFDAIRKWWPEAPEAVYVGADPLHVQASSQGGEVSDA